MSEPSMNKAFDDQANGYDLADMIEAFQIINNKEDFSQLTNTILEKINELARSEASTLLLVNKTTGDLEIAAVRNVPEEIITNYIQHPVRAIAIADFYEGAEHPFENQFHYEGISSLAAADYAHSIVLPIRIRLKTIGYITVAGEQAIAAKKNTQEKLTLYMEFAAQAIESAYFIYQLKQQNAHLELMMTKLQNTQNNLKRSEKMALVGKLSASIAHEIRNPLTIVGTSLQLAYEKMESNHPDHELYDTMINKVREVDQTIKELMVFARPVQLRFKAFALSNALDRVITFVSKKFSAKQIAIENKLTKVLPDVYLDEEQMQRILINLLLNAYDFLNEKGIVTLTAIHEEGSPWLELKVADNGLGIPKEHLHQIFDPFFSTRREGSGLGLFMVKHVLEEMDGTIEVENIEPQGAVFILSLPVVK